MYGIWKLQFFLNNAIQSQDLNPTFNHSTYGETNIESVEIYARITKCTRHMWEAMLYNWAQSEADSSTFFGNE